MLAEFSICDLGYALVRHLIKVKNPILHMDFSPNLKRCV
jgi:hypothetical protein